MTINSIMPIEYTDSDITKQLQNSGVFVCCYPSISLKTVHKDETKLAQIYQNCPRADYYAQHDSTGKRAVPGTAKAYQPTEDSCGIINMYIHIYPKIRTFSNDNHVLRVKWFTQALESLHGTPGLEHLHLEFLPGTTAEHQEYATKLEDFLCNYRLNHNGQEIYVHVHGTDPGGSKKPICVKKKPEVKVSAPKARASAPGPEQGSAQGPVFTLEYDDSQLCGETLYEVDFVQYTLEGEDSQDKPGVLKYFPDGWDLIVSDRDLQEKAKAVDKALGDLIGAPDVFPPADEVFNAFNYVRGGTPRVVILGQDPYHGPGQAHGLSFSVKKGVRIPPSLNNIYKALTNDEKVDFTAPKHGCLTPWAEQGVIMLNSALTVLQKTPKSHLQAWEPFTDRLIQLLSTKYKGLVFVLWGAPAQKKKKLIANNGHMTLEFNHPSPMVRNNTFATECKHFGQINEFLQKQGKTPIDWRLAP